MSLTSYTKSQVNPRYNAKTCANKETLGLIWWASEKIYMDTNGPTSINFFPYLTHLSIKRKINKCALSHTVQKITPNKFLFVTL